MPLPAAVFRAYPACRELRPYVCGYMTLTREGPEPERTFTRALPGGMQESRFSSSDPLLTTMPPSAWPCISFNFGDPWTFRRRSGAKVLPGASWVSGVTTEVGTVDFPRRAEAFDVMMRPGVAPIFFGQPADGLTDQVVSLDDVWGPAGRALAAQVAEARSTPERIRLLERELLRRLRAVRWIDAATHRIAGYVEGKSGVVSVTQLCQVTGLSRQHLARRFRQHIGVSPKQFCRFTRFHNVLNRGLFQTSVNWADVSAEFGYYDQAHLIAEFKEFTGFTPAQFFRPAPPAASQLAAD